MGLFLKREVQGAVSILLVVIMMPLMVLSALMVDTARYSLSKSMVASAGDLAMNAALADYDTILKDVYGLFAMSQADDVEKNVKQYFEDTLVSYGVVGREDAGAYVENLLGALYQSMVLDGAETANFLSMTVDMDNTRVEKVNASSLASAAILEKQIVEYMKYRGPVDFGMSFFDSLSAFTKVEEQTTVIEAQVKAQEGMGEVAEANRKLYWDIAGHGQGSSHVNGYDDFYKQLQDDASEDFKLKEHENKYGNILLSYRERYAAVHRLALIFCATAYSGNSGNSGVSKWELDDAVLQVLNGSGDYITQSEGRYNVSATRNTDYGSRGYDKWFKGDVDGLWSESDTNRLSQLYGGRKFGNVNYLGSGYCCFVSEDGQEQAIAEFGGVDLFYKVNYSEYKALLDKLDKYVAAAMRFDAVVGEEIEKYEEIARKAREEKDRQEKMKKDAEKAIADSTGNLSDWNYGSYREELADYEKNLKEMEHASEADRQKLQEENDQILDGISDNFPSGTVNNVSFAQEVINEKNNIERQEDTKKQCDNEISAQSVKESNAQAYIDGTLKPERDAVAAKLQQVLGACQVSANAYNADLKEYKNYKIAVRDWMNNEVNQIAIQFNTIHNNLELLDGQLKTTLDDLANARQAISAYLEKLGSWDAANRKYVNNTDGGSGDNFSMINDEDIESARDTFDLNEVDKLGEEVRKQYNMVHGFLAAIDSNFSYMNKECIGRITTAERVREVVAGSSVGSEIAAYGRSGVTSLASDASINAWFLYTDDIDPDALEGMKKLTAPYPCCRFMNYLYQTFKESNAEQASGEEGDTDEKRDPDADKAAYDTIKAGGGGLTDKVKGSGGSGTMPDLGYQYTGADPIGGTGYPSSQDQNNQSTAAEVKENTDTSSTGLAANKAATTDLLSGLGNAMETGRDKLLVMSYLFENFSYNTIVQDMAREQHKDLSWPDNYKEEYYKPVLGQARTSSGIAINGTNNPLYGAEIEYVLFGNSTPEKNVTSMKASIFAIRTLFNSIYAFTDSEIRNMARAVGMSVQAASLGVIPYQLVMVVVQLALAIGESAIDMQKMNVGEKVAIIKSDNTWMLSGQGMLNLARATVTNYASYMIDKGSKVIEDKISEIMDAKADELTGVIGNMGDSLKTYAENAIEETTSRIFARIETTVETCINEVAYFGDDELPDNELDAKLFMVGKVDSAFDTIKSELHAYLDSKKGEDSVEGKVCAAICNGGEENQALDSVLDGLAETIKSKISNADSTELARTILYEQAYGIREAVSGKLKGLTKGVINSATTALNGVINSTKQKIEEKAGEVVEKGAEATKEAVVEELNTFMDKLSSNSSSLSTGSPTSLANINGVDTKSGNLATQIKFGYSDYLKLFVFIGLCASDKSGAMICRIGDLIQYNIAKADEGSDLRSKAGDKFTMAGAKTYISIDAVVDLDMMFLNLGIFQRQIESYNEELSEDQRIDLDSTLQVHYIGISGY